VFATLSRSSKPIVQYPVRVVYYVEGYSFGGVERHVLGLLDDLDRERFEPMVVGVMADELEQELVARLIPVVRLDRIRGNFDIPGFFHAFRALQKARPVIFHAMLSHSHAAQYAIMAAIALRTPVVMTTAHLPTQSESRMRRRLGQFILRGVDMQVLPSEWTKAELLRLDGLHGSYEIVANGIALPALLSREQAREQLGIAGDARVIGGSMRLVDWKRPELIVEAAREIPGTVAVILGEGPEVDRLRSSAKGVDLRLPGFRMDAVSLLPAFDVFMHPCPIDNQPLAIFEAMAAGVPVIVADQGGAALMVDDERTGLRAPATAAGMSGAVSRLLDDPAGAGRLAAAGRDEVLSRFTTEAMTRQLENLYDRLLAADPRKPDR
jgi:glycosyltransferase involved in cell wall biosynthesis